MAEISERTYDFTDIRARVGTTNITILAISYKLNREIGKGRDNSPKKKYRTRGYIDPDGSIRIHLHDLDAFIDALKAVSPTGAPGDATFEVSATYGTDDQPTRTDTFERCILMDIDVSHEAGSDGLEATLPIDIGDIIYNGTRFFNDAAQ